MHELSLKRPGGRHAQRPLRGCLPCVQGKLLCKPDIGSERAPSTEESLVVDVDEFGDIDMLPSRQRRGTTLPDGYGKKEEPEANSHGKGQEELANGVFGKR